MTGPSLIVKTMIKNIYPYLEKGISKDEWTVFALWSNTPAHPSHWREPSAGSPPWGSVRRVAVLGGHWYWALPTRRDIQEQPGKSSRSSGRMQTLWPWKTVPPSAARCWARHIFLRDDTSKASAASSRCANETICSRNMGFQTDNRSLTMHSTKSAARDTVDRCPERKYPSRRSPGGSLWCQNVFLARGATSGPCSGSQGNYRSVPPLFGFYSGCFHSGFFHKRTSRCPPSVDAGPAKSSYQGLPMLFKSRLLQDGHLISNYILHQAHAHTGASCVHFIKDVARDTLTSPTRSGWWVVAEQPFKGPLPRLSTFFLAQYRVISLA